MLALGQEPSSIRELFAYGLARKAEIGEDKVFDFSIGNPSVPSPAKVGETLTSVAASPAQGVHGYSPAAGLESVRSAIAASLNRRFGTNYTARNLYMTCGAAGALAIAIKALSEPDDEIIVNTPFFPEYRVWIEASGDTLVPVPMRTSDFQLDIDALRAAINKHTKAVIINSPNNPVGVVYSEQTLQALAQLLTESAEQYGHPIFIIADEPYREIVYADVTVPWVPSFYKDTIVCYSWSKSLSLPGERIGYALVPDQVSNFDQLYAALCGAGRALGFVCAPVIFQHVAAACVDEPADVAAYARNREALTAIMDECGYEYIQPQGAFYLWVRALEPDARAFAETAKRHELLLVPSDSFGVEGWVRLGYCVAESVIRNAAPAFKALKQDYE
jgi:aspartate aminotransferase